MEEASVEGDIGEGADGSELGPRAELSEGVVVEAVGEDEAQEVGGGLEGAFALEGFGGVGGGF